MSRQLFILVIIYFVIQELPFYTNASKIPNEENTKVQCSGPPFRSALEELKFREGKPLVRLFKDAEANVPNAKCKIDCMMKKLFPKALLENGDLIIQELGFPDLEPQVLTKLRGCATLTGNDRCDQTYQRLACVIRELEKTAPNERY